MFERHCLSLMQWTLPNYGAVALTDALPAIFALVLFVIGAVHFSFNSFLDKTRTRIIYNVVIMHGVSIAMFMALQPQYVAVLLPLMLADTAIVYGHFFALTYNRFSHVLNLLLIVAALAMMAFTTII